MDNLDELKKIWFSADTSVVPDTEEILSTIKFYRKNNLWKKVALVVIAVSLTAIFVAVVFLYKSVMISTRLGEGLMILAGLMLVYTNMKSVGRLYRVKDFSNKEFINYMEEVQRNRAYYYKRTQAFGMALIAPGMLLYIYEFVSTNVWLAISGYVITVTYLVVIWFVIRPRAYRYQKNKLKETIRKMTEQSKQL